MREPGRTSCRACGTRASRHSSRARSSNRRSWSDSGDQPYAVNVGAYLPAAEPTTAWIALVAHYDHLGVHSGSVYAGADDNAGAVAMLLALGDALGRARPPLRRHVVLLFSDAEEPPNIRTDRMGSAWFWRHPPFPLTTLHCALVFDLLAGPATPGARDAGLDDAIFVLGAEASPGLARLARGVPPETGVEPLLLGLPLIEAYPFFPWRRFAQSDYHGLREQGRRPFLFVTGGRASTYHTAEDTPDTLDYAKLARLTRWVTRLLVHAAEDPRDLGWTDMVADPLADARAVLRLYASIGKRLPIPVALTPRPDCRPRPRPGARARLGGRRRPHRRGVPGTHPHGVAPPGRPLASGGLVVRVVVARRGTHRGRRMRRADTIAGRGDGWSDGRGRRSSGTENSMPISINRENRSKNAARRHDLRSGRHPHRYLRRLLRRLPGSPPGLSRIARFTDEEILAQFGPSEDGMFQRWVPDRWEECLRLYLARVRAGASPSGPDFPRHRGRTRRPPGSPDSPGRRHRQRARRARPFPWHSSASAATSTPSRRDPPRAASSLAASDGY